MTRQGVAESRRNESARKPRVCFVCLYAYPLLNPGVTGQYGGSEVRIVAFARALARRGRFDVHMLVFDHGQPRVENREGITVHARSGVLPPVVGGVETLRRPWVKRLAAGNRLQQAAGLALAAIHAMRRLAMRVRRSAFDRLFRVDQVAGWSIHPESQSSLEQVDADLYVAPGNNSVVSETLFYCRNRLRPFVFLAGSDGDFHPDFKEKPHEIGIYGYAGAMMVWNIENATAHVVQTEAQQAILQSRYGHDSRIVRNPISLVRASDTVDPQGHILWVGKSDWIKRPELCFELARQFPSHPFVMVVNPSERDLHARFRAEAATLGNVTVFEHVPFERIDTLFANARLFVSTSKFEGFPNTFLQAGKYGVPIVSLEVDPGEMLTRHGAGRVAHGDLGRLVADAGVLLNSPEEWKAVSEKSLAYVRAFHDIEKVVEELEAVLFSVIPKPTSSQGEP